MKGIMIQGTSSDAGKSFLATAFCRALANQKYKVCPFKSQNMSNNSYVTPDGLEMGRAQAVQAEAARLQPDVYMNPILLKPRKDTLSEIILLGKVYSTPDNGSNYFKNFTMGPGIATVRNSLAYIQNHYDLIVIEGAGSPAEINLNATEIVNMRIAREADVPVILVTDVDRGGSLASIVGTLTLLGEDRKRVKGIIFNKFRGDITLFEDAVRWIEDYTKIKVIGVMPYLKDVLIESEDSLSIDSGFRNSNANKVSIGIVKIPYVSNNTDIEPLRFENDIEIVFADKFTDFKKLDAVIIPGTKSTIQDMKYLHDSGIAKALKTFYENGGFIFGICGGYQMLGETIRDEMGIDNPSLKSIEGLGLLPVQTSFETAKTVNQVSGTLVFPGSESFHVSGYEIHFGKTEPVRLDCGHPLFMLNGHPDGFAVDSLRCSGTYLHNVFHNDGFRNLWLNLIRNQKQYPTQPEVNTEKIKELSYESLAKAAFDFLDMDYVLKLLKQE
ncbi:MAG TPA: cobyric acid synthase [Firmicutes bacterium]|jgi:adenosylcobyric acid synthase|nr:cobyric acid synthase [Bacillota bacterium]